MAKGNKGSPVATDFPASANPLSDGSSTDAVDGLVTLGGVEFPISADDLLAYREYPDKVVVVTKDGRRLSQPKVNGDHA